MLTPGMLQIQLRYTDWASRLLVEAAGALTQDELTRDFGTADKSVLGTLVHVFAADRIWYSRVVGPPQDYFTRPEDYTLDVLRGEWPRLLERWQAFAEGIGQETVESVIRYKDLRGNEHGQPLWQILLHMVNHGTHHRGQVSGFLRAMARRPPATDLIYYYRQIS
jgi:uncharacterized damage-inducible protein DinB